MHRVDAFVNDALIVVLCVVEDRWKAEHWGGAFVDVFLYLRFVLLQEFAQPSPLTVLWVCQL